MKLFVPIFAVLALAAAKPSGFLAPVEVEHTKLISAEPTSAQFHAQDELGQYNYGYTDGLSTKQEVKTFDGKTRGSYSYVDAEGKLQTVDYSADAIHGFRVAATNLPKPIPTPQLEQPSPVEETPEVMEARREHLEAIENDKTRPAVPEVVIPEPVDLPKPVEDTPEVKEAKLLHFAAKEEAELQAKAFEEYQDKIYEPHHDIPLEYNQVPLEYSSLPFEHGHLPLQYNHAPLDYSRVPLEYSRLPLEYSRLPLEYSRLPLGYTGVPLVHSHAYGSGYAHGLKAFPEDFAYKTLVRSGY